MVLTNFHEVCEDAHPSRSDDDRTTGRFKPDAADCMQDRSNG